MSPSALPFHTTVLCIGEEVEELGGEWGRSPLEAVSDRLLDWSCTTRRDSPSYDYFSRVQNHLKYEVRQRINELLQLTTPIPGSRRAFLVAGRECAQAALDAATASICFGCRIGSREDRELAQDCDERAFSEVNALLRGIHRLLRDARILDAQVCALDARQ